MTAQDIKFRPSSLGSIMSGVKKGWSVENSLTCKRALIDIYRKIKYGRYYSYSSKYTEKGTKMEESAISLYSLYKNKFFKKNKERIRNGYFDGEPDIIDSDKTIDTKCSWGLDSFPHPAVDSIDSDYELQGYGYMDLTGKRKHVVTYCLVNAPANLIAQAKKDLWYKMNCPEENDDDFMTAKIEIEKNMIFDMKEFRGDNPGFDVDCNDFWEYDIPINERVIEFEINYDEVKMQAIKKRCDECRMWMQENLFKNDAPRIDYPEKIAHGKELLQKVKL